MKLKLTKNQHDEIMEYVKQCSDEIGGLGTIIFDEETGDAKVEKLFMVKQKVHGTTCELDPEDIGRVMTEAFMEEAKGELIFWWHSHVHMSTGPSGQDDRTMAQIGNAGTCVAMIINKKGETSCRYYQKKPKLVVNIPVEIETQKNEALEAAVKANIEKYVSKLTYAYEAKGRGYPYSGHDYSEYDNEDYFHARRLLHEKAVEETTHTEKNEKASTGVTIIKGEAALREYFYNDFIMRSSQDKGFANEVYKDYYTKMGTNAIDMEELIGFYIDRKLNQKFKRKAIGEV